MFRRPLTCILHKLFAFGSKKADDGREVLSLPRPVAEEITLASLMSIVALTDVSVPYLPKLFATDASMTKGAVVSKDISPELSERLWLCGDRKGGYTKLDNEFRSILRGLGSEYFDDEDPHEPRYISGPASAIDFVFDFVEICGGSGVLSKAAASIGLTVCTPIGLSSSPHFDLCNLDLLWWILGMIRGGRFRSVCLEPPCTTFSAAQHPASRSYSNPLGFNRSDPKTLLGNTMAFRCLLILWYAGSYGRPSLLEQPRLSKMAWLALWRYLLKCGFSEAVLASCRFGSPHQKEFRFLGKGIDMGSLEVRCSGDHQHIPIQGQYTRASAVYTEDLALFLAQAFKSALDQKDLLEETMPKVEGLESVVLNDLLMSGGWDVEHSWRWRYPSHINIFESISLVSLEKKLIQQGGDARFVALLDSRVAKGAHAKGRSSSNALRSGLLKSCSYLVAGNLHPAYGFAPTRLNVADAPTRQRELPTPADLSIVDFYALAQLHSFQFSRAAAGWIRLFILLTFCLEPVEGAGFITYELPFGWIFYHTFLTVAWISCCIASVRWISKHHHLQSSFLILFLLGVSQGLSVAFDCNKGTLGNLGSFTFAEAMPITPAGTEDLKRAQRRAGVQLFPDRVVNQRTRSHRDTLLEQFDNWLAESFRTTLHELVFGRDFHAETVAEALTSYGKQMYYAGKPYGRFSETINAVTSLRPTLRKQVSQAWDLAFNWVADEPHEHHPALPLSILLAVSGLAILWGWAEEAAVLLITWTGLLRIGEVLSASRRELVLPSDSAPGVTVALLRILQPKTRGRSAKHQTARIDFPDVIQFLEELYGDRSLDSPLWRMSPQTLRKRFSQLQVALGLDPTRGPNKIPYDLGSLRPGGATFYLQQTEDSEFVRRRGRWLSTRVLEIYLQEASVNTYQQRLSSSSRSKIEALAGSFSAILGRATYFLQMKIPPSSWPHLW